MEALGLAGSMAHAVTQLYLFFQAEDGIRDLTVTGVQTCALPICKHVLPTVGNQPPRQVTFTSLQLLLNKLAADGYGETSVGRIRTYIKACFEYATEDRKSVV